MISRTFGHVPPVISLLLLTLGATATAADIGACLNGRCSSRFTVLAREVIREGKEGALVWTRATTSPSGAAAASAIDAYYFCSATRPARITVDDGGDTKTVMLAPLSGWEYEAETELYNSYFEVCHGAGVAALAERENLAKRLGYNVLRIKTSRPLGLTRPEGIFYFPPANRRDHP